MEDCALLHYCAASEVEHGVQAAVIREVRSKSKDAGDRSPVALVSGPFSAAAVSGEPSLVTISDADLSEVLKSVGSHSMPPILSPLLASPPLTPPPILSLMLPPKNPGYSTGTTTLSSTSAVNLKQYSVHAGIAKRLFADRDLCGKGRDIVYLRTSPPGKCFETSYEREKHKLPLTLTAYLELLKFFKTEYSPLEGRMEMDFRNMQECREWIKLEPAISFCGGADIEFRVTLDKAPSFSLDLWVTQHYKTGKKSVALRYSDETMGGSLPLPPLAMQQMARNLDKLAELLNKCEYKEPPLAKRARQ